MKTPVLESLINKVVGLKMFKVNNKNIRTTLLMRIAML